MTTPRALKLVVLSRGLADHASLGQRKCRELAQRSSDARGSLRTIFFDAAALLPTWCGGKSYKHIQELDFTTCKTWFVFESLVVESRLYLPDTHLPPSIVLMSSAPLDLNVPLLACLLASFLPCLLACLLACLVVGGQGIAFTFLKQPAVPFGNLACLLV